MKDILLILTGGTIGSFVDNGIIAPEKVGTSMLLSLYEEEGNDISRFDVQAPFSFLSENANTGQMWELARYLLSFDLKAYKGVIITHGTDTISFEAAFLSILLENLLDSPIFLVSAGSPLSDPASNGLYNFEAAINMIDNLTSYAKKEVLVPWKSDFFSVFRGAELVEADTAIDDLQAYGSCSKYDLYPGELDFYKGTYNWRLVSNDKHVDRCKSLVSIEDRAKLIAFMQEAFYETALEDLAQIKLIRPYPGLDYNDINVNNCDAILAYTYHSSTVATEAFSSFSFEKEEDYKKYSFNALLDKCKAAKKRLYLAAFKNRENVYLSVANLDKEIIRLEDMSVEAAYANVMIAETIKKMRL